MKRLLIIFLFVGICAISNAQELPKQYREKFSESYPIRKEQHLEMKTYVDKLLDEKIKESMNSFQPDFFSISDYENSLYPYRQKLGKYFGYPPPGAVSGKITRFEKAGEDKYSDIYRVWIEAIEGVHTYGLFMVPKDLRPDGKAPLLITMHGGSGNPEAICGLDTRINYHSFGHEAVKRGYIVWAPGLTMLSSYGGDQEIPGVSRDILNRQLKLLGSSIVGVEIQKIIESTRVLVKERTEIDIKNIGMTGLSWGSFFTMYTTALCPFIKAAAPSASFRDTDVELRKFVNLNSSRDYSLEGLGHFQAIGLICPRPCMIQVGKEDNLTDTKGAQREAERAALFYEKLGVEERFSLIIHPGGHEFENESIFDFFDKYLSRN